MSHSGLVPVRGSGPLGKIQTQADALKLKVDELTGITNKWNAKSAHDPQVVKIHHDCVTYKIDASSLLLKANNLQKHEEPGLVTNFDQRKSDEIKRLQFLQNRLDRMIDCIEELENGNELRKTREKVASDNEEKLQVSQGYDEDDEDDDDGDEDGDGADMEDQFPGEDDESEEEDLYIVTNDFKGERDGDLSITVDEIVDILSKREDGWWEAENEQGQRGLVPSNFLQPYVEEDEESESEVTPEDMNSAGDENIPATDVPENGGKESWQGMKDEEVEPHKTDVTDVLTAMGALPAGFRPSMLYNLQQSHKGEYSLKSSLLPILTPSNMSYQDLHWDSSLKQLRRAVTRTLRSCRLWKCQMIPLVGPGIEVLSRHIRIALFDGTKVLGNIHTVRAYVRPKRMMMWYFSPAGSKIDGILPSILEGFCVVRTDNNHANMGILFELGLTYIRNQTGQHGELSCGWAHLKLFDEMGNPMPNKTHELLLNGGTPFEQGVAVDPSILRRAATSRFRIRLAASRKPKLFVQLSTPSNVKRKYLELLPSTIILPGSYCELTSYYRRVLADALLRDRATLTDGSLIHSPATSVFLAAVDRSDVMDTVLRYWLEKTRMLRRGDKRDKENMKQVFKSVVLEIAYPLLHCTTLPAHQWANLQTEAARFQHIYQTAISLKQIDGVLSYFLSSANDVEPFDITEVAFDPLLDCGKVLS